VLTDEDPAPTREAIAKALDVHLCRCTGYVKIIDAVNSWPRAKRGGHIPAQPDGSVGRVGQPLVPGRADGAGRAALRRRRDAARRHAARRADTCRRTPAPGW
jgi:hypothetical protein